MSASVPRASRVPRARARAAFEGILARDRPARARRSRALIPRASARESERAGAAPRDVVVFAYDALVDATAEMTRVSHAAARARWPESVPGEAASYVSAMTTMRRCIPESTSCEGVVMVRVIAEEAIIGGRTTSGGRPGPVFSFQQRHERRTRPLTVDEVVSSWPEIKLMSVLKWGEEVESSVGWDGRKMMPAGLQDAVDALRVTGVRGEQVVYEELKPLLQNALKRGCEVYVMTSRGRSVEHCRDVLLENGFAVATDGSDEPGVSIVNTESFPSRSLAAANLIATTARPGERWYLIDGDVEELERFDEADFGDAYASLTEGVYVSLNHAAYAYASPRAIQRASMHANIHSLTADSARTMALNFLGDVAHVSRG